MSKCDVCGKEFDPEEMSIFHREGTAKNTTLDICPWCADVVEKTLEELKGKTYVI